MIHLPWPGTVRGLILWLFGWAFIFAGGLNYLGTTPPPVTREYLAFAFSILAPWVWGLVFLAVGGVAVVSSYHGNRDRYGYGIAAIFSGLWGVGYVWGWLFYDAPARAIGGAIVWLLYSAILLTCQRIPKVTFDFIIALDHDGGHQ